MRITEEQLDWYTNPTTIRTGSGPILYLRDITDFLRRPVLKLYRNPIIYAKELEEEMIRDNLTRKQLAERHGVSSDRITQWLCLLKLPEGKLKEIEALGDYWDTKIVSERQLRALRRSANDAHPNAYDPTEVPV